MRIKHGLALSPLSLGRESFGCSGAVALLAVGTCPVPWELPSRFTEQRGKIRESSQGGRSMKEGERL